MRQGNRAVQGFFHQNNCTAYDGWRQGGEFGGQRFGSGGEVWSEAALGLTCGNEELGGEKPPELERYSALSAGEVPAFKNGFLQIIHETPEILHLIFTVAW